MNKSEFNLLIDGANLGALGEQDAASPVGDAIADVRKAWTRPNGDVVVSDDLRERLISALDALNACYDDNGFTIDAPAAFAAENPVCAVLEEIETAIYTLA